MSAAWLNIVGIGEDGLDGLSSAARSLIETAEVIVGGDRHHDLAGAEMRAERIKWPSPFDALITELKRHRGRRIVVLVTGDPLWFSVGARIINPKYSDYIPVKEVAFHPQLSAFQWAAARMGWSLADVEALTVHGRPAEQILPNISPGRRLLVLTQDGRSPAQIAGLLKERGFGPSKLTVLAALGGPNEERIEGLAEDWSATVPDFHTLAIECCAEPEARPLPRTGLPDDAFTHDGRMTKRDVRAVTLAKLAPRRGERLWDIGSGCGSVAIEWMRAAADMDAIGIEPREDRRAMAAENALTLGAPRLKLIEGTAPDALRGLPAPDAVFIGGGLSEEVFDAAWTALNPFGRLVANAVTLESEAVLLRLFAEHGGELTRIAVSQADPVGGFHGWRPSMPVTQWSIMK